MIKILYQLSYTLLETATEEKKWQEMAIHSVVTNPFLQNSEAQLFPKHTEIAIRIAGNTHGA